MKKLLRFKLSMISLKVIIVALLKFALILKLKICLGTMELFLKKPPMALFLSLVEDSDILADPLVDQ